MPRLAATLGRAGGRQGDGHHRAAFRPVGQVKLPAVTGYDGLHNGQPQPRPVILGGKERVQQVGQDGLINAGAAVVELQDDIPLHMPSAYLHDARAVHGLLFVAPAMIGMRISWWYLPVYLVMQVCMNAVFLYSNTVCRYLLGNVVGDTLLRSLHMIIAWLVILVALPIAILVTTLAGIAPGLLAGSLYLLILAVLLAWAGSASFVRMEQ